MNPPVERFWKRSPRPRLEPSFPSPPTAPRVVATTRGAVGGLGKDGSSRGRGERFQNRSTGGFIGSSGDPPRSTCRYVQEIGDVNHAGWYSSREGYGCQSRKVRANLKQFFR